MLGVSAFENCTSLNPSKITINIDEAGTINAGAQDIGTAIFAGCTGFKTISLEGNLLKIVNDMFKGCSNLTSIDITTPVTYLGSGAFDGCSSLRSFVVPETVIEFGGARIFAGCTSIEKLIIPLAVTTANGGTNTAASTVGNNGWFQDWVAGQVVEIEYSTLDTINWSGYWYMNTKATINFVLKVESNGGGAGNGDSGNSDDHTTD